ncbi:unnamed protein product [Diamesa serratosioi]
MKLSIVLFGIFVLSSVTARDVEIDSFNGLPETDPQFMSFGTTRVTKKDRQTFVISGDFEVLKSFGDEHQIRTEILNSDNKRILNKVMPACEFMKKDRMTWPQLVANSNIPKQYTCPFPKGKYIIKDFVLESNQVPPTTLPGTYVARLTLLKEDKIMKLEFINKAGITLIAKSQPFCEFTKNDNIIWPGVIEASNMPKNTPCPFPKGSYSIKDYYFDTQRVPKTIPPGQYVSKISWLDEKAVLAGYETKVTIKI